MQSIYDIDDGNCSVGYVDPETLELLKWDLINKSVNQGLNNTEKCHLEMLMLPDITPKIEKKIRLCEIEEL